MWWVGGQECKDSAASGRRSAWLIIPIIPRPGRPGSRAAQGSEWRGGEGREGQRQGRAGKGRKEQERANCGRVVKGIANCGLLLKGGCVAVQQESERERERGKRKEERATLEAGEKVRRYLVRTGQRRVSVTETVREARVAVLYAGGGVCVQSV